MLLKYGRVKEILSSTNCDEVLEILLSEDEEEDAIRLLKRLRDLGSKLYRTEALIWQNPGLFLTQ